VVWFHPAAHSEKRTVPPPITIQSISADDKGYPPDPHLSLPAHTSSVQISYTAVSLSDPEAIRFRYKLQETDKDWHAAATATPIPYRNLPRFLSLRRGGVRYERRLVRRTANVAFTILPAFYQTTWFRLLCVTAFLTFLWGLHRL
jgi:hypothetical protein